MKNEEQDTLISPIAGQAVEISRPERPVTPVAAVRREGESVGRLESSPSAFAYPTGTDDTEFEKDFSSLEKKKFAWPAIGKKKAVLIAGILLVAVVAAVAASHFWGKNEAPQGLSAGDRAILDPVMEAMRNVSSYSYDGAMNFTRTLKVADKQYGMRYDIIYKGVVEKAEGGPFLYSSLIYDTVRSVNEAQASTSVGMQSVVINGKKYLKMDNLLLAGKDQGSRAALTENTLKGVSGSWYAVTDENYHDLYYVLGGYAFLPENLDLLSVKGVDRFNKIFDYDLLSAPQDLGSELIEEVDTAHYKVGFNTKGALELITVLSGENGAEEGDVMASLREIKDDPSQSEKFQKVVDYVMQKISMEIWVGKADHRVYRFRINGNFDDAAIRGFYTKLENVYGESYSSDREGNEEESISFDVDYTLSGFDTAKVRDVEGAKDFAEVTEKIKQLNPYTPTAAGNNAKDSDGDGLSDEDEKKYGSDPQKTDTDGDGYGDGSEVKGGYDPIVAGSARLDYGKLDKSK